MDFSSIQIGRVENIPNSEFIGKKLQLPRESLQRIRLSYFIGCCLSSRWKEQMGVFLLFQTINSSLPSYKDNQDNSFPRTEHNLPGHGLEPTWSERGGRAGKRKTLGTRLNSYGSVWSPAYEPSGGSCPCIFQVFFNVSVGLPAQ